MDTSWINPALVPLAVPLDSLVPDPANARKHGDRNIQAIRASIREHGQQKPIVIDANGVVRAGNGMLRAAELEGHDCIAAVRYDADPATLARYGIQDNRTAELAEWDWDVLGNLGVDLEEVGWNQEEVSAAQGLPPNVDFKEYDETTADDVKYITCPKCGEKFPA